MRYGLVCLLWSVTALSQIAPQTPLDDAIQGYWKARNAGRFEEAVAKREVARSLLAQAPPENPQFGNWVQNVTQMYQNGGMQAKVRDIAQEALARSSKLGDAHPTRILLLNMLATAWQEDRNLLNAVPYLEKAASALESAPPQSTAAPVAQVAYGGIASFSGARMGRFYQFGPTSSLSGAYQRLAELYQQLGRPEATSTVMTKMRALAETDSGLAALLERQGKWDDAAAVYQKQSAQAASDPQKTAGALQALADLYQRQQRYGDAAAVLQQAIANLDASSIPMARNQSFGIRQNLAGILRQAGRMEDADKVYEQILVDSRTGADRDYANVLSSYASFLTETKRGRQAESLLSDYLATQPQLQPWQETNLLYARATAARDAGDNEKAGQYQRAAEEKSRASQNIPQEQNPVSSLMNKAQLVANGGNLDEAFSLALRAMDVAPAAPDREQIVWGVPNLASILVSKKAEAKAEQLYQRMFAMAESWSPDNLQPLLNATQNYARFLMGQKNRAGEVGEAIERYRKALIAARGAGTGHLDEPLRMTIEFEQMHAGSSKRAFLAGQDLLALEESLSGTTSEPYLRDLETLAGLCEFNGELDRALALKRQTVAIGDLVFPVNDARRGLTRMNVALVLARQKQYDEAERLAGEAVAIGKLMRPPQTEQFVQQLEQIRRMKTAPASGAGANAWFGSGNVPIADRPPAVILRH